MYVVRGMTLSEIWARAARVGPRLRCKHDRQSTRCPNLHIAHRQYQASRHAPANLEFNAPPVQSPKLCTINRMEALLRHGKVR
jgi:hypothetical protein